MSKFSDNFIIRSLLKKREGERERERERGRKREREKEKEFGAKRTLGNWMSGQSGSSR